MKFDRNSLPDGKRSYLVFDLEDLAGNRSPVCAYAGGEGERLKAVEHAEDRGGVVVSADWTGFIDCTHVSSKVEPGDVVDLTATKRLNEEASRFVLKTLIFIQLKAEPGSRRKAHAESGARYLNNLFDAGKQKTGQRPVKISDLEIDIA